MIIFYSNLRKKCQLYFVSPKLWELPVKQNKNPHVVDFSLKKFLCLKCLPRYIMQFYNCLWKGNLKNKWTIRTEVPLFERLEKRLRIPAILYITLKNSDFSRFAWYLYLHKVRVPLDFQIHKKYLAWTFRTMLPYTNSQNVQFVFICFSDVQHFMVFKRLHAN